MEVLIVVLLIAILAGIGFIAVRHQQTHTAIVAMRQQERQVADFDAVVRDTIGTLTTDEWREITAGNMDSLKEKVQKRFAATKALNPVYADKRRQLEKQIARLNAAAEQAEKNRISYDANGYSWDANNQKQAAAQYTKEADNLRAQLAALT